MAFRRSIENPGTRPRPSYRVLEAFAERFSRPYGAGTARAVRRGPHRLRLRHSDCPHGHFHDRHGGPFEACPRCQGHRLTWTPSTDFGIVVHAAGGRLAESALAARLLVP